MLDRMEALLDGCLGQLEKRREPSFLSYAGISEIQDTAVSVALIFFPDGIGRALCQLTHCPEAFEEAAASLANRINRLAPYRATLEDGVFTLAADFLIPESADAQRILSVLWTLLGAADQHHIGELRDMIGPLPNRVEH